MMDAAERAGGPEAFLREGIFHCGAMHSLNDQQGMTDKEDLRQSAGRMFGEIGRNTHEMDIVTQETDTLAKGCPTYKIAYRRN